MAKTPAQTFFHYYQSDTHIQFTTFRSCVKFEVSLTKCVLSYSSFAFVQQFLFLLFGFCLLTSFYILARTAHRIFILDFGFVSWLLTISLGLFHSFQQNKADVKAIMARFQASGASTDETSSTPAGRTKQPLHSTLSSGPTIPTKKPVLESLSGSAINVPPKANFLKNTVSTKSDTDAHEPNKTKALANRFANNQDDITNSKPFIANKQHIALKPPLSPAPEDKGPGQKPPLNKPSLSSTLSDSKPAFPKPSPAAISKPSWVKEDSSEGGASSIPPKIPPLQQKPSSSISKLRQQNEELAGANTDSTSKPSLPANSTFKPPSNFRTAQNMFKEKDKTEQSDSGMKADGATKPALTATSSIPPPKPPASKKPSLKKPAKPSLQTISVNGDVTSGPKRNPLPNSLALGPAPAKPNRPPKVNLENFKRGAEASDEGKLDLY